MSLLQELGAKVLDANYDGTKSTWGAQLLAAVHALPPDQREQAEQEVDAKTLAALGQYVSNLKITRETQAQRERNQQRAAEAPIITYTGKALSPTLSVHKPDGGTQLALWAEVSPMVFVEAVRRQARRIDGLVAANALRAELAEKIQQTEELLALETLQEVCDALGIDPDKLGLEELPREEESA